MGRTRKPRNLKTSSPIVKQGDEDDDYDLIMSTSDSAVDKSETGVETGADSDPDYDFENDAASSGENSKRKRMDRKKTQRSTSTTYSATEEQRQRARESYRMKISTETPEEKEERNRKERIGRQQRIKGFSSEQRNEYRRKQREWKQRQFAKMTPEELKERKERMKEKLAKMTPEERLERLNRVKENREKLKAENPIKYEEERRNRCELRKNWYLHPERHEMMRLYARIRNHKINAEMDPKVLEEKRKHKNFQAYIRRLNRTEEDKKNERMKKIIYTATKEASMTEEELEAKRQRRREMTREYEKNVKGDQKERNRINSNKASAAWLKRNIEKVKESYRNRLATENSEQKQKRLLGYRIAQAKMKLRKKLKLDGVSPEEIQKQAAELVERMRRENPILPSHDSSTTATGPMSAFKPRGGTKSTGCTKLDRESQSGEAVLIQHVVQQNIYVYDNDNNDTNSNSNDYDAPASASPTTGSFTVLNPPCLEQENVKIDPSVASPTTPPTIPYYGKGESQPTIHLASSISDKNNEERESKINPEIPITSEDETLPKTRTARFDPNKTWNCPKCQAIVHSHYDLTQHYRTYHFMPNKFKKGKVLENESSEEKVEIRERRAFSSEKIEIAIPHKFVCMKCPAASPGSTFETKENLLAHVKRKHRKSFWPCSQCGILKYSSYSHQYHFDICIKVNKNVTIVKTDKCKSANRSKCKNMPKKRK